MRVRDVMTSPVVVVRPATSLGDVARILRSRQIGAVPVVDTDRQLLGLVSEGDLLALETIADQRERARPARIPQDAPETADQVMTRDVICVDEETDTGTAAQLMSDRKLRHMPVLRDGRVTGMLSRRDLIGMLGRPDAEIEADVTGVLDDEFGHGAPAVAVRHGHVYVDLPADAPTYRLVEVLATSVPGVTAVSPA